MMGEFLKTVYKKMSRGKESEAGEVQVNITKQHKTKNNLNLIIITE